MHYLLGPTQTLGLAALLLVLVASLPALPALSGRAARWPVLVCLSALLGSVAAFWSLLRHSRVLPNEFPSAVVRYAAGDLQSAKAPNVVVIEGASYVLSAVDTELLEQELASLGYQVRAVRIAAAAANHFERYHMQDCVLERLDGLPDSKQHWVYMAEVQAGYDTMPLAQFMKNQDTARTYHYTTLENGWYAVQALRDEAVEPPEGEWHWPLLRHTLINAFNAGALQRLVPEDSIELSTGRVTNRLPSKRFKFRGMAALIDAAGQPPVKASIPNWLFAVREPRVRDLWRGRLDELVYFGVPSTTTDQVRHIRDFCAATPLKCIAPDAELLQALDDKTYWRNPGHVSFKGVKIYTPWLARALARTGALKK